MPIIADTVKVFGAGTATMLVFERLSVPAAVVGGGVESAVRVPVLTDADGDFSKSLPAGSYALEWRIGRHEINRLEFSMPDSGGPYTLAELLGTPSDGGVSGIMIAEQDWLSLKARTLHVNNEVVFIEYLDAAGDGQGGRYIYDAASTSVELKPDVARPDNVDADDAGRWIKHPYP